MKDISITVHRRFSAVVGETSLLTIIEQTRRGLHSSTVHRIMELAQGGQKAEAEKLKKTLPYLSLTANYKEERLPHSLLRYNHVLTVDIDGQLEPVRRKLASDAHVLTFFLSPKQHGYKVFVYLRTAYACKLRDVTFSLPEITYDALEKHHALMYDAAKSYIEQLTGVDVDGSGRDLSRGFFQSSDPDAYLNRALLAEIPECVEGIVVPAKAEKAVKTATAGKPGTTKQKRTAAPRKQTSAATPSPTEAAGWEVMEYRRALSTTRRTDRFEEGNRDAFLYVLGNRCFRKGISEATACSLIERDFGRADMDVLAPVRNAYTYTSKTEAAVRKKKEAEKVPLVSRVIEFLESRYSIRRNVVLDRLEFRSCTRPSDGLPDTASLPDTVLPAYRPMRNQDYNSIFMELQLAGIPCFQNYLKALIDSNYARDFNPFTDYLDHLPEWDGTDYIGLLADSVVTDDRELWHEGFRRWLVGMVACALHDDRMNQLVLILYSEQGKGKSSWTRRLLPPEWKEYFYNGMIDPRNKDHAQLLSTRLIINMEEFEGVKPGDLAELKRIITQENVTQRKVYDLQAFTFVRHASFIGSTNNRQCLQDVAGNRRFLPVTVREVDYRTAVNYAGVYSQALSLLRSGFRYWYEGKEIERLNAHNELHRLKDPVEENLFVYFRPAEPEDFCTKWMPAALILSKIAIYGKVQANRQSMQALVQVLQRHVFSTRTNAQGSTEYKVVEFQTDDVERNSRE
ncbi:MAG: hypothetical protein LUE99_09760 [Bacteroides sp.]|nr:hypothetical protein [Bacteroides sp.]